MGKGLGIELKVPPGEPGRGPLPTGSAAERWFVAACQPRKELLAITNLTRQGFVTFCPRFYKTVRHARQTRRVLAPLFPGYVFVRFDPDTTPWRCINSTTGVRHILTGDGGAPSSMPTAAIDLLMQRCEGAIVRFAVSNFHAGMQARIVDGALADQIGMVESLDDKGRVTLLIKILGGDRHILIDSGLLAPN